MVVLFTSNVVLPCAVVELATVVKELRRGYTWQGRVLRYAEVQAARSGPTAPEASDHQPANGTEKAGTISATSSSTQSSG